MSDSGIHKYEQLSQLIHGMLTGNLTEDEFQLLDRMMSDDPKCLRYYIEYTALWALLDETEGLANIDRTPDRNTVVEEVLTFEEKSTGRLDISGILTSHLSKKGNTEKRSNRFGKWIINSIIIGAAAVLLVIIYFKMKPANSYLVEITTIAEQMNARWENEVPLEVGSRLGTNEMQLSLKQGMVKLRFNDDVDVLIEGPAAFRIDQTGLILDYGSLYGRVSRTGRGFTVKTHSAQYIDLGTVFGLTTDIKGVSELHVFKGKVQMIADFGGAFENSEVIQENHAIRYTSDSKQFKMIPISQNMFVTHFDSQTDTVLRGQNTIDLADIVGGGNGLGTGIDKAGIDPVFGKPSGLISGTRTANNDYHPVSSNLYVDGVFIPDGSRAQVVSSQGHVFDECPVTNGSCFNNIGFGMRIANSAPTPESRKERSILMHANTGITFDLEAIHQLLQRTNAIHFQSKFGIERNTPRPDISNADFWIVVDGALRFKKKNVKYDAFYSVDIELSENDRFLTLIVTDGGDPETRTVDGTTVKANDSDWGMFAEPVLTTE